MILFVYHPLIDNFVQHSLFSELLEHHTSRLLYLNFVLEVKAFSVQIECFPGKSLSQSSHYDVSATFLGAQVIVSVTPSTDRD